MQRRPFRAWFHGAVLVAGILALAPGGVVASADTSVSHGGRHEHLRGVPLTQALRQLQDAGLKIIYSTDLVRPGMTVTEEPRSQRPRAILNELLAPHGLAAKKGPNGVLMIVPAPPAGTLEGEVRAAGGAGPLSGVRIVAEGTGVETHSGLRGRFRAVGVRAGTYNVTATLPGYVPQRIEHVPVREGRATRLRIEMARRGMATEQVTVRPTGYARARGRVETSRFLDPDQIESSPEFTHDPFRTAGRLPGLVEDDTSAALHLRGGTGQDVLVMLDGVELCQPFHLKDRGGLVSIVDSRFVGGMTVLRGAFPAEYGGRMAGVVELDSARPQDRLDNGVSFSSDDVRIVTQGFPGKGAGRWLFSARRGNPSPLLEDLGADPAYQPRFYDLFGTYARNLGERNEISFHFLSARDDVEGNDEAFIQTTEEPGTFRSRYKNDYAWLTIKTTFRPGLFARTVLSVGQLSDQRSGSSPSVVRMQDRRSSVLIEARQDWILRSGRHAWKWGLDIQRVRARYDYDMLPGANDGERKVHTRPSGGDLALYLSDHVELGPATGLEVGLRWEAQTYRPVTDRRVAPRINLARDFGRAGTLRLGWGYFFQPERIYELQVEDGVDRFGPPERAEHRVVEWSRPFRNGLTVRASVYDNRMTDLRPRYENLFGPLGFFPEARDDRVRIATERARARGFELTVEGPSGTPLSWWAGYARARADDRVGGLWIPRSWDQRHAVGFGLDRRIGKGWHLGAGGTFHSGRPTTPVEAQVVTGEDGSSQVIPVIGPRNSNRLPDYLRLDLRAARVFAFRGNRLRAVLNLTNVLDRDNVCCVRDFDLAVLPDGRAVARRNDRPGFPRMVTFEVGWTF